MTKRIIISVLLTLMISSLAFADCNYPRFSVSNEGCYEFQGWYDHQNLERWYNCSYHPNAKVCWDVGAYRVPIPNTDYVFDAIEIHDNLVVVYNGIINNENRNGWIRVIRIFEHLNAFTLWYPSVVTRSEAIKQDFAALQLGDIEKFISALLKYGRDKRWKDFFNYLNASLKYLGGYNPSDLSNFSAKMQKIRIYSKLK